MTLPVVVIGMEITALGTLRSIAKNNIPVFLDCGEKDLARQSKYYQHAHFLKDNYSQIDFDALAKLPYEKLVLIPCSDRFVRQLAQMPDKYRDRFLTSSCSMDALSKLVYKNEFAEQINLTKINAPKTFVLNTKDDLQAIPDTEFNNMFLKPVSSARFIDKYDVKAMRVASKEDALDKFEMINNDGFDLVLQEYIPGPTSNHYFIDGFVDKNGDFKAFFARQRFRIYPVDFGNSCYMYSVPLEDVSEALEDIKTLLTSIKYRGIFSVEFKKDENTEQLKIIEVNARCWMYVQYATDSGINMPMMAYQDAQSQPVESVESYPIKKRCVYPFHDFKAYQHRVSKDISLFAILFSWIGASQPVFCWSDPKPALVGSWRKIKTVLGKLFGG